MKDSTRRGFVKVNSMLGAVLAGTAARKLGAQQAPSGSAGGFQAASDPGGPDGPGGKAKKGPGIQNLYALCEVTGGGKKVYGIAVEYDAVINPASLALDTYTTSVFPAGRGGGPGMMGGPGVQQNPTTPAPKPRPVVAIYTNAEPALLSDRKSVTGMYVITEFAHDADLSTPTSDSDKVCL